jgi:hypothetical protein
MLNWPIGVLSPVSLFFLLSLLIPVAIHLFNKSRGKLVHFGSIALLKRIRRSQARQIRLLQRLLLLCRLLLILLCVLLLAQLFVGKGQNKTEHILVTPDWLDHADSKEKNALAKVMSNQTVVLLTTAKKQRSLSAEQVRRWQKLPLTPKKASDTWLMVSHYMQQLSGEHKITVYSTNKSDQFMGKVSSFAYPLDWQIKNIPLDPLTTITDTVNLLVVFDSSHTAGLAYLKAAINLLKKQRTPNLTVRYGDHNSNIDQANWIFWLSDHQLNNDLLTYVNQGGHLLLDAQGLGQLSQWQVERGRHLLTPIKGKRLGLNVIDTRLTKLALSQVQSLWPALRVDKSALLTSSAYGKGTILRFNSRFDRHWNDLVLQAQFPQVLLSVLFLGTEQAWQQQQGRLSEAQINNVLTEPFNSELKDQTQADRKPRVLARWLIALIVLLWFIERVLSELTGSRALKQVSSAKQEQGQGV